MFLVLLILTSNLQGATAIRKVRSQSARLAGAEATFRVHGPGRTFASMIETNTTAVDGARKPNANKSSIDWPMGSFVDAFQKVLKGGEKNDADVSSTPDMSELMRMSVVRIHSITKSTDWFHPFFPKPNEESIGSGFAVQPEPGNDSADDPIFMTNAHVVRNAHTVQIQLPAMGQATFDAYVPMIYDEFDLAIVRLLRPKEFLDEVAAQGGKLKVLRVEQTPVSLGLEVVAVGFPLGSSSLKLSRGVIAGTEQVHGSVCYQSTAPISPGNSGGPLFSLGSTSGGKHTQDDLTVIGVNFAAAVTHGAENVNYVIPIVHLQQILYEFVKGEKEEEKARASQEAFLKKLRDMLPKGAKVMFAPTKSGEARLMIAPPQNASTEEIEKMQKKIAKFIKKKQNQSNKTDSLIELSTGVDGDDEVQSSEQVRMPTHKMLRVAPVDIIGTEGNEALYKSSGGCSKGFYISKVGPQTALQFAAPNAVPDHSFLVSVNGVSLDKFGMGRLKDKFLGDPLPFESIMGINERLQDPVTLKICKDGNETEHKVSMVWNSSYETGIKAITEPYFERETLDFEHFADITVMQMTQNHLMTMMKQGAMSLGRWLMPENQEVPHLIVADVARGTYAARNIHPGMVVEKVNGKTVHTLDDYRNAFEPEGEYWTIETDRGLTIEQNFEEKLLEQVTMVIKAPELKYLVTEAVKQAAVKRAAAAQKAQQDDISEQVKEKIKAIMDASVETHQVGNISNSSNSSSDAEAVDRQPSLKLLKSKVGAHKQSSSKASSSKREASFAEVGPFLDSLSAVSPVFAESTSVMAPTPTDAVSPLKAIDASGGESKGVPDTVDTVPTSFLRSRNMI